jgi:hypothetical protein
MQGLTAIRLGFGTELEGVLQVDGQYLGPARAVRVVEGLGAERPPDLRHAELYPSVASRDWSGAAPRAVSS